MLTAIASHPVGRVVLGWTIAVLLGGVVAMALGAV